VITEKIKNIVGAIPHGLITSVERFNGEDCIINVLTNSGQNIEFRLQFKYVYNPHDFSKEIVCPTIRITNPNSARHAEPFDISREDAKSVFDFRMAINRFVGELCSL
jgi:hypothetical protein